MSSYLACFDPECGKRYPLNEVVYSCGDCSSLLEVVNDYSHIEADKLRVIWRKRRVNFEKADISGVWRFREMLPFVTNPQDIVTLPEGNTPLFDAPIAADYTGLGSIQFKHQGYNPTGSFKDNGMTAGQDSWQEPGCLCLDRQYICIHGCLCCCSRYAGNYFPACR